MWWLDGQIGLTIFYFSNRPINWNSGRMSIDWTLKIIDLNAILIWYKLLLYTPGFILRVQRRVKVRKLNHDIKNWIKIAIQNH